MKKLMYNKKFSLPHWDNITDDNLYFECFKNSSQQWKNEIYDIYFGVTFSNDEITYGNTMGVNITKGQYKNLLKIQEKYGTSISLTLNEMNRPLELIKEKNVKDIVAFIKKYYDDGVRSCTISHTHLMRIGALQSAFPDMDWKNTVNHRVTSTQSFIDYTALGYTTVQLDRDLNRNLAELKRVKVEADRLNVRTCLLIKELCMPECPFKTEHDCWQSSKELLDTGKNYWETVDFTCNRWRPAGKMHNIDGLKIPDTEETNEFGVVNPRVGTNMMIHTKKDWEEFAGAVDIFKISGRLTTPHSNLNKKFVYALEMKKIPVVNKKVWSNLFLVDSFKTVYDNDLAPFHMWFSIFSIIKDYPAITDINDIKNGLKNHFWNKKQAALLQKVLMNCKNQCYKCHKCDDLFGTGKIDSVLEF